MVNGVFEVMFAIDVSKLIQESQPKTEILRVFEETHNYETQLNQCFQEGVLHLCCWTTEKQVCKRGRKRAKPFVLNVFALQFLHHEKCHEELYELRNHVDHVSCLSTESRS